MRAKTQNQPSFVQKSFRYIPDISLDKTDKKVDASRKLQIMKRQRKKYQELTNYTSTKIGVFFVLY